MISRPFPANRFAVLLLVVLAGCSTEFPGPEDAGRVSIALAEAPADVWCIAIEVQGARTVERSFDVVPGMSTEFMLGGLPLGDVLIEGAGYGVECSQVTSTHVPGWVSDPVPASLSVATAEQVVLAMRRNGRAEVSVDFVEDPPCLSAGSSCSAGTECCSLTCAPDPLNPGGPSICHAPSTACPTGQTDCGGVCRDLLTDPANCGACGATCPTGQSCVSGTCQSPCSTEVCDGVDNDCDFVVDEGNPGGGGSCSTGQTGVCSAGTLNCVGGTLLCTANQSPTAESCDGLDNDCDGLTDEGNPGGGATCATGLLGVCSEGTTHCVSGALVCTANESPTTEICGDFLDNDCDGVADDGCP